MTYTELLSSLGWMTIGNVTYWILVATFGRPVAPEYIAGFLLGFIQVAVIIKLVRF